jgi:seryl-tRNA(Sec) selenium transferase
MGAPTSGMICGRKELVRACYLQNWGIGRAMKVGKEGIAGLLAALERWYGRDTAAEERRHEEIARALGGRRHGHRAEVEVGSGARQLANVLREGKPPVWVADVRETSLVLDLRALGADEARLVSERISHWKEHPHAPQEDVPYHDLYWSERRLLSWPD